MVEILYYKMDVLGNIAEDQSEWHNHGITVLPAVLLRLRGNRT